MKKLLFFAVFLSSIFGFAQDSVEHNSLVSVTGTGTVHIVPDKVLIKARVEHTGKSAAEVKAHNDEIVNEVIKYLKSKGIEPKNFRTEYLNLNKDYNYNTKETFFSANQAISIQLNDLDRYEEIMRGLLETGLNRIDGIEFQTSKNDKLEAEARKLAVLNAREKASEYAEALGQSIGQAYSINEVQTNNFPPMYRAMEMKSADSEGRQTIAPGELEIVAKVNVGFKLL